MKSIVNKHLWTDVVLGTIDMHLPLEITNHIQTMKTEVSVLKHLLIICQLEKVPLLDILSELRRQLKYKLHELIDSNPFVYKYIENVIRVNGE